MKRKPLKRTTAMKRGPWRRKGKASRAKSSYRRRPRFVDYMLWVKTLPCVVQTLGVPLAPRASGEATSPLDIPSLSTLERWEACTIGEVEADHAGPRAMGRKAHDATCIPICKVHHDMRTNGWGLFWDYTLEMKREWKTKAIAHTQQRAREQGIAIPEVA